MAGSKAVLYRCEGLLALGIPLGRSRERSVCPSVCTADREEQRAEKDKGRKRAKLTLIGRISQRTLGRPSRRTKTRELQRTETEEASIRKTSDYHRRQHHQLPHAYQPRRVRAHHLGLLGRPHIRENVLLHAQAHRRGLRCDCVAGRRRRGRPASH